MRPIELVAVAAGAVLFACLAWHRTTSSLYYRSANSSVRPPHVRPEDYEQWVIARRKRWRRAKTVVGALLAAAVGWVLFTMIDSGLAQR
jgi:hypothetical protein